MIGRGKLGRRAFIESEEGVEGGRYLSASSRMTSF